jgi:aldose 1-epimerase
VSKAGEQGFPGRVRALCAYSIPGDGIVRIELTATTDAPTVVNLAGHSYFNLDDTSSILDHRLEIPADSYTPVDDMLIPTGDIASVANTPFDFRMLRPIRQVIAGTRFGYDHNFVVARTRSAEPRLHARVIGPVSGTEMQVWSTEMGIQFYDGAYLGVPVPGLGGRMYGANAGLCLEPQYFPDTPNKPQFGDPRLSPGEEYRQVTDYRFQPA